MGAKAKVRFAANHLTLDIGRERERNREREREGELAMGGRIRILLISIIHKKYFSHYVTPGHNIIKCEKVSTLIPFSIFQQGSERRVVEHSSNFSSKLFPGRSAASAPFVAA